MQFPLRDEPESASHSEVEKWDTLSAPSKKPRLAMESGPKAQLMQLMVSANDLSAVVVRALPYPRLRTRLYGVSTMGRFGRSLPSNAR